jgi:hypothetical protein
LDGFACRKGTVIAQPANPEKREISIAAENENKNANTDEDASNPHIRIEYDSGFKVEKNITVIASKYYQKINNT